MPAQLFAPTISFVRAKRIAIVLSIAFISNMFLLAIVGHATVLPIYVFAILYAACAIVSCIICWKLLLRYEPRIRILFGFIIPGNLIFGALLGLNYLTAKTREETCRVINYYKEGDRRADKWSTNTNAIYVVNLENQRFADYKEFRMFQPYLFDTATKSISYETGTGCLGIGVVKGYSFNK